MRYLAVLAACQRWLVHREKARAQVEGYTARNELLKPASITIQLAKAFDGHAGTRPAIEMSGATATIREKIRCTLPTWSLAACARPWLIVCFMVRLPWQQPQRAVALARFHLIPRTAVLRRVASPQASELGASGARCAPGGGHARTCV
jgi:hypothetical protein